MAESGQGGGTSSSMAAVLALVAAPVFIILLLVVVLAGGGATPPPCGSAGGTSPGVGTLTVGGIPAEYVPLIQKAGTVCPEFPAPVIAAQIKQESNFSDATSGSGAEGPAQFMPETWKTWGNGGNVHDPVAAVDAQARFDCALANQVKQAQASGQIHSSHSVTELALGGYNAGFGAVLAAGDVPGNSQTQAYVPSILSMARDKFSQAGTVSAPTAGEAVGGGSGTQAAGCGTPGQVQVRPVTYPVPGVSTQAADLYVPVGAGPGTPPRPVVVMVHGGGFFFGDRSELAPAAKAAAEHGYYVLNIDYDLSAPRWPRQLEQVRAAVDYVRAQASAESMDASRIALLGDSAGGGLVLEAGLLGDHSGVQAVVSWSGPTDFTSLPAQAAAVGDDYQKLASLADPAIYLGCPLIVCPDLHRQASPALSMTPGAPATMLVSSDRELVPLGQLTELDSALRAHGAPVKTLVFPGDRHATAYTADANGPTLEWLDATLHFTPPAPTVGGGGGGPKAQAVVAAAQAQLGLPYIWGGGGYNGPTGGGFDCSGLTAFAFHQVGLDLPRTAQDQYAATANTRLPGGFNPGAYEAGDLLFWGTAGNIHHVAIAMGNGQLIQASTFGEPLNTKPVYNGDFFAATRPLGGGNPA